MSYVKFAIFVATSIKDNHIVIMLHHDLSRMSLPELSLPFVTLLRVFSLTVRCTPIDLRGQHLKIKI